MLFYNILKSLVDAMNVVFAYMPDGRTLPIILGVDIDNIFSTGIAYVRLLAAIFPPFTTLMVCASVYLTWRLIVLGLKVALGSRAPSA